jgi:hypothetical protein
MKIWAGIKKYRSEWIVSAVFLFLAFGFNVYRIQGDGLVHYAFLEKMLCVGLPESPLSYLQSAHFFQSGCAFFNAPFYIAAYLLERILSLGAFSNGITLRAISINIASNFYILVSILLVMRILRRLSLRHAAFAVVSILFSTSAFTVAVLMPSWGHAVDIFVNTLFIYLFLDYQNRKDSKTAWLGLLGVIAILVRYVNIALIVGAVIYYLWSRQYKKIYYLICGFIALAWVIPAIFAVYNTTPSLFTHTEAPGILLKGAWGPRYLLKYLLHPLHGLFVWAPAAIMSAIGLAMMPLKKQKFGYMLLIIWLVCLLPQGMLRDWYAGWSFTNRYIAGLFPILVIGLAAFLNRYGKIAYWTVVFATLYSVILYLNWHFCVINGEFGVPADMIHSWQKGFSDTFTGNILNLNTFLNRIYESCRYKYLLKAFL